MTHPDGGPASEEHFNGENEPSPSPQPSQAKSLPNPARVTQAIITRREQLFGYLLAAYAAVGFLAIWVPILEHSSAKHHSSAVTDLAIGLGMAIVLAATARWGRAYFLGAAALLVGLGPWNTASVLGFPAIGLGGWMLFRTSKSAGDARRAARAAGGNTRPQRSSRAARNSAARSRSGTVQGSRRSGGKRTGAQGPVSNRPTASKRYTPPKH